ncbi:hypothetical protein VM1G_11247 [Cytospora mali]|uniref:HNH nuclease domain-containing protein n=1 Tax=Cytospora mali TaxID=578113 RepID=A0A194VKF7_CYTMA|nr:hypothetical protein VM1G_11247 [Valsa mali]
MAQYMIRGIDDAANLVNIRSDLHFVFDKGRFTIVPKPSAAPAALAASDALDALDAGSYALSVHVLKDDKDELVPMYHNLSIRPEAASEVSREALFARFAMSIFPLVQSFLETDSPRHLAVIAVGSTGRTPRRSWMNRQQLTAFRDQRGETPTGSRKRMSSQISRDDEVDPDDQYQERWERRYDSVTSTDTDEDPPDEYTRWHHEVGRFAAVPDFAESALDNECYKWYHKVGKSAANRGPGEEVLDECTRGYFERVGWPQAGKSSSERGSDLDTEALPNLSRSIATCSNRSSALLDPLAVEAGGQR